MYTLYYAPGSANLLVHLALLEIGAPHELKRVDLDKGEQRSAAYLAINPNGVVRCSPLSRSTRLSSCGAPISSKAKCTSRLAEPGA